MFERNSESSPRPIPGKCASQRGGRQGLSILGTVRSGKAQPQPKFRSRVFRTFSRIRRNRYNDHHVPFILFDLIFDCFFMKSHRELVLAI
ncbi:hypothetical protein CKAN_02778700 [Cinnamomum micranthum f. kanehirae]|uniref:Uncharacterized protein n=1 Tax=Cinnamomum micranthum f. kanehirae TaxID=337451 RepID=A0A3S3N999_9MAGN|nr:hypothetical protein CKAN_02778700 [Cinnamomum micranthum f. kanehirae]